MDIDKLTEYLSIIRVSKQYKAKVIAYAEKHNTSISKMVRYALDNTFFKDDKSE